MNLPAIIADDRFGHTGYITDLLTNPVSSSSSELFQIRMVRGFAVVFQYLVKGFIPTQLATILVTEPALNLRHSTAQGYQTILIQRLIEQSEVCAHLFQLLAKASAHSIPLLIRHPLFLPTAQNSY
jgi:hypothetical protein